MLQPSSCLDKSNVLATNFLILATGSKYPGFDDLAVRRPKEDSPILYRCCGRAPGVQPFNYRISPDALHLRRTVEETTPPRPDGTAANPEFVGSHNLMRSD